VAELNVQNQQRIEWPRKLVVAKAYVDQLERSQGMAADRIAAVRQAIEKAEGSNMDKKSLSELKSQAGAIEKMAGTAKSSVDAGRMQALADILKQPVR